MQDGPVYRGILGVDIAGFNRTRWTDPIRRRLRERLYELVDHALADAELTTAQATRSDRGDGLWLLVAPEVSTARLLHPLASRLASGVAQGNLHAPAQERMRLRVVVHAGELLQDSHGHAGASWNLAARLLDAEATRAVLMACPAADVIMLVSEQVHDGVVRHDYEGIDAAGWQPVWIHAKETDTRAWVHLPGQAAQPTLPAELVAPPTPRAGPAVPRELPRPAADFTGRADELATLRKLLRPGSPRGPHAGPRPASPTGARGRPVVITAIDGMGGIGKSALALQIANQLADAGSFPDGQLYVNLQAATPGLAPLEPLDALGRLLRALGLDPALIPSSVE